MSATPTVHTSRTSSGASGVGCLGLALLVTVVLGTLKMAGALEIGWLWIFAPTLAVLGLGAAALLLLLLVVSIGAGVIALAGVRGRRKQARR